MASSNASTTGKPHKLPTDLGEMRTIMAADRTLMAWVRTSLSMLSFGFTIYKFLQAMSEDGKVAESHSPQRVGLFLVGIGVLAMLLGTLSYWATLRDLNRTEQFSLKRPVLVISLVMSLAGVALFFTIAERLV